MKLGEFDLTPSVRDYQAQHGDSGIRELDTTTVSCRSSELGIIRWLYLSVPWERL